VAKYFRITYYFGAILLFLVLTFVGFTQTRSFKSFLRTFVLSHASSVINGSLRIGQIDGNLATGFIMHDVVVSDSGGQIIAAPSIELRYDPIAFFLKRASISRATIVNPDIHLWRTKSGELNITRLFASSHPDTTPSSWIVDIKGIELTNARLEFTDSLRMAWRDSGITKTPPAGVMDYAHIRLDSVRLSVSLLLASGNTEVQVHSFSFHSRKPEFTLTELRGDFRLTKQEASIRNFSINTPHTHLHLGTSVKNINLAALGSLRDLEKTPVDLHLTAEPLDTHELKQFLFPWIDFLDNALTLQIDCSGKFGALAIEQLRVRSDKTDICIKGEVDNLHTPSALELHLTADNVALHTQDIEKLVPGLHLTDLTYLGDVAASFTFEGRPADFHATVAASTAAGDVTGDAKLNFTRKNFIYDGIFTGSHIALGTILGAKNISTDINAKITVNGEGTNPRTMTGIAKVEMDSSLFNGLHCEKVVCIINVADSLLRSRLTAAVGSGNYELSASAQFQDNDALRYGLQGRVISLDLGEVLQDHSYDSDLSFQIEEEGLSSPNIHHDSLQIDFLRSSYQSRHFDSGKLKVLFANVDNAYRELKLTSDVADFSVNGQFTLASLIEACTKGGKLTGQYFSHRIKTLDSLRTENSGRNLSVSFPAGTVLSKPVNANFSLNWKDLSPLGMVLGTPLEGDVTVNGTIAAVDDRFSFKGHIAANTCGGRFADDTVNANAFTAQYDIRDLTSKTFSPQANIALDVKANVFQLNTLQFDKPSITIAVSPDSGRFAAASLIDSTVQVDLQGTFAERKHVLEFEMPVVRITFDSLYTLENAQPAAFSLGRDGMLIRSWAMAHDTEYAQISGYFDPAGVSDAALSMSGFSLASLPHILHRSHLTSFDYDGTVRASGSFKGTFEKPVFTATLLADNVEVKKNRLGHIEARASYSAHMLDLLASFAGKSSASNSEPDLFLSGTMPFDLSLRKDHSEKLEGDMDLTLRSKGMDMVFLSPFLPVVENLSGTLTCDMKIKGSVDMPEYEGALSIQNASFLFTPLQLRYILNGRLIPDGTHMRLTDVTIKNAPESGQSSSLMQIDGFLALHGLSLSAFDLTANGRLLIMDEAHRIPNQKFYGTIFTATGQNGIHWRGNAAHSTVTGQLFPLEAAIILPPDRDSEIPQASTVAVTFRDDTSRIVSKPPETSKNKTLKAQKVSLASRVAEESFLDHIDYDLIIETQGPTSLRFVFNTQTSEELFANLSGRVTYNKVGGTSRFIGQVSVGERSYYNFFKKFDATGRISFTGNLLNPELNVVARYEGLHKIDTSQASLNEKIAVVLNITGTREEPNVKTELYTYDNTSKTWTKRQSGNEESDALSFIVSGQFSGEITEQQRTSLLGANLGFGMATNMIAGTLSETLRRNTYGYVQSVDVLYYGGQFDKSADVRLTGQVGDAVIKYGGRVIDDPFGNANVSFEYPIKFITHNLLISIERKVEGLENTNEQRTAYNSAKIFYRISF
jgi:hypothetical protein